MIEILVVKVTKMYKKFKFFVISLGVLQRQQPDNVKSYLISKYWKK